jgi:hypothetical protein
MNYSKAGMLITVGLLLGGCEDMPPPKPPRPTTRMSPELAKKQAQALRERAGAALEAALEAVKVDGAPGTKKTFDETKNACMMLDDEPEADPKLVGVLARCAAEKARLVLSIGNDNQVVEKTPLIERAEELAKLATEAARKSTVRSTAPTPLARVVETKDKPQQSACDPIVFAKSETSVSTMATPPEMGGDEPEEPSATEFDDLNGDGQKEFVVTFRDGMNGNGGLILQRVSDGSCFKVVYMGAVPEKALKTSTNGWKDVTAHRTVSFSGAAEVTLQFLEGGYKIRKVGSCQMTARGGDCGAEHRASMIDRTEAEEKVWKEKQAKEEAARRERAARDRVSNARRSLPGLFGKCSANKAKILVLRRQGMAAARAGNQEAAQAAMEKLRELEPTWNDTLIRIREAIGIVTDDEGPEFRKLIMRVKRECST